MSADARIWCDGASDRWTGWADGTDVRPIGTLTEVIAKLQSLVGHLYWLPTQHDNGPALNGWCYPRNLE